MGFSATMVVEPLVPCSSLGLGKLEKDERYPKFLSIF